DRYKIHDIEIVIDTIVVSERNKNRLSKSIEQAFKLGNGLILIWIDKKENPIFFSKHLMCIDTGISYGEPSPNTFAFNSPYGACAKCKGLGKQYKVSVELLIPDKSLSIEEGAIVALGKNTDSFFYRKVQRVAKKYGISLKKPIRDISETSINIILYGDEKAGALSKIKDYEGIFHMIDRWKKESTSDAALNWVNQFIKEIVCPVCNGSRLKKESLYFKIIDKNISEVSEFDLQTLQKWVEEIEKKLTPKQKTIAKELLKEIQNRLTFLLNVGLYYLSLNRNIGTLSGGELQRIRLATQIGSQLQGITYILDEPSIGLHPRDNDKLVDSLKKLRDMGNNIIVVEHDKDIIFAADYVIDIGPKAGFHGGHIVFEGTPQQMLKTNTMTAQYLMGQKCIPMPENLRQGTGKEIVLKGCTGHNLKNIDAYFPLGKLILVTGVSGSGKSTLVNDTLYPIMHNYCYHTNKPVMPYKSVEGLEHIDKIIEIDQSPIGRTPRSNPATYCGFFTDIRELFSSLPESKIRGYKPGRFSFNVKGGRCDMCEGVGVKTIKMNFLPDVYVACDKCQGRRFNRETLEIRYKGKSITDVLNMTVDESIIFFNAVPNLYRKIKTLQDVGLGYITLGQNAVTLSGGEAQRIKLATELSKRDTGKTFYILDEPTTGLHFQDIAMLLEVLQKIVNKQNTVLIVEHNLDVIKVSDYVIDLGKEGGRDGGNILFAGEIKDLCKNKESYTAKYLKKLPEIKKLNGFS
ncbi:MAG: excinuclease ABC subunit UvrA, partial [Chitinophagaceae bacterium]